MKSENYRKKLSTRDTKWLKKKAVTYFNEFIRNRDKDLPCISCGSFKELQAGHFYSGGHYQCLRFAERNVNGQCLRCNYFLRGNLTNYRTGLLKKYDEDTVNKLDLAAGLGKQIGHYKLDRTTLIELIMKYR